MSLSSLSASQLRILRQCAEEQCSVIEILQELRGPLEPLDQTLAHLVASLQSLAEQSQLEFFIDEFAAAATRPISIEAACQLLKEVSTWDIHSPRQLHVNWLAE